MKAARPACSGRWSQKAETLPTNTHTNPGGRVTKVCVLSQSIHLFATFAFHLVSIWIACHFPFFFCSGVALVGAKDKDITVSNRSVAMLLYARVTRHWPRRVTRLLLAIPNRVGRGIESFLASPGAPGVVCLTRHTSFLVPKTLFGRGFHYHKSRRASRSKDNSNRAVAHILSLSVLFYSYMLVQ